MELATPVRIHRSVVDVDVSASRSRSCVLSVVIWSDTSQSRLLARRHFHVPAQDVVRAFAQSTYELGVGVFEYSLP